MNYFAVLVVADFLVVEGARGDREFNKMYRINPVAVFGV